MISKKYASDYRMDTEPDQTGRIKNKMIYTGPLYKWSCTEANLKKIRITYLLLALTVWAVLIGQLLIDNYFAHLWYIIVPFAGCVLSWGYFSVAVFYLFRIPSPFNRELKDKQHDRINGTITVTLVLLCIALIGQIITVIRVTELIGNKDILFTLGTILLIGGSLWMLRISKGLTFTEIENPMTKIWADK